MHLIPGDVIETVSIRGTKLEWLYCGKMNIDSSADRLFFNITTFRRNGLVYGCYFPMSKWSLEELGAQSIKKVRNVDKAKALRFKNKYKQLKREEVK